MTRRITIFFLFLFLVCGTLSVRAQSDDLEVYLVTCSPGTETYSMYGHSALRLVNAEKGSDNVYNWGVFDFSTPNFNYKFARGRLEYMLAVSSWNSFLQEYFSEERSVWLQRVNLDSGEIKLLLDFLENNMKPENRFYRYDFFMDNCSTRIRDIFESVSGDRLVYPSNNGEPVTYRQRLDEYTLNTPWLDVGIDLLIGSPGDELCGFRESMFLPDYLMHNLSESKVIRNDKINPLLGEPIAVFEFAPQGNNVALYLKPWFILSCLAMVILMLTFNTANRIFQGLIDYMLFSLVALLAILMIFANYLTDHLAMGNNYNIIWLNPLLIIAPFVLFVGKGPKIFWSSIITLQVVFMIVILIVPQSVNPAFVPLSVIIIIRAYYRLTLKGVSRQA